MNKYRLYPVITLIVLLIVFCLPVAVAAQGIMLGDVNGDGDINVGDVVLAMRFALDIETPTAQQKAAADVDGDGDVNVKDVTLIMRRALELIDRFPAEKAEPDSDGKPSKPFRQEIWVTVPTIALESPVITRLETREELDGNSIELKDPNTIPSNAGTNTSLENRKMEHLDNKDDPFVGVFSEITNLNNGDLIYLEYQGILYTYEVFRSTYEDFVLPEYGEIEFTIPEFVPEAITDEQLVTLCQIRYIYALDILAEVIPIGFYIQGRLIDIEDK